MRKVFTFFCLEFLCFLGKAIRKLVRKATLVAPRILRFPWLNPSGFSPKYSRQAALLALIDYIFQMIDQGTVMYTNRFWSHLTLDSVAFGAVVTVRFVPVVVDYLFISTLKKKLSERDFWPGSGIWRCQLLTSLQRGGKHPLLRWLTNLPSVAGRQRDCWQHNFVWCYYLWKKV